MELKDHKDHKDQVSYVIKHQQYELAGWLREREKELMDEIDSVVSLKEYIDNLVTEIRHTQYHYLLGLLDEFYASPVTGTGPIHFSHTKNVKESFIKDLKGIMRNQKIDDLFGDSTSS